MLSAQKVKGKVLDENSLPQVDIKIRNKRSKTIVKSNTDGQFEINLQEKDTLVLSHNEFDTLIYVHKENKTSIVLKIQHKTLELSEASVTAKRLKQFDVGYLPVIRGVQINNGTNAVIELEQLNGAKSTGNAREIFAKIPGLNIWESDGAGIQIGIGGRGLSPNRAANFNTRQNGYDISADALGYPESYYTPPTEALKSIEILRGSAALQFGTQFGGLLNFIIKDAPSYTPLEFTTRNTVGSYGYFGTFNRITGTKHRFFYQLYHQYKRGDGYRKNSAFQQHQVFAQVGFHLTEKSKIKIEYTHMNYLARQAGGLTDVQFENNDRQSLRNRNWFKVNWNMLALIYDIDFHNGGAFNVRAFGMLSNRESLGFLGKISQADPGGNREMIAGDFKNAGAEVRYLQRYRFSKKEKAMKGAFLVGGRYYQGYTTSLQGTAPDGDDANFTFLNRNDLENSNFSFPSQNLAFFAENITYLTPKLTFNIGMRYEYIQSASDGFYKRYVIHPVNFDTLAIYKTEDYKKVTRSVPLFGGGLSYKYGKQNSVYYNFTQNYRAINFTDIRVNNPNIVIDSNIRDEYGYTMELGTRGMLNDYFIYDLAGFYVFYGDKIGLAPKTGTIYKERTNIGDAINLGVEVFSEFDFLAAFVDSSEHHLSLFVNFAYIYTNYIKSKESSYIGNQVEYVSPIILRSGIKWSSKRWSVQVQGAYNSAQFADATNSVEPSGDAVIGQIPSYMVFDASARFTLNKYFSFEAGVNNFTNSKYYTRRATAYPGPGILPSDGINFYGTVQFKFGLKK